MKIDRRKAHIIFSIFVFVALASLDNVVIGLFPPLFSSIAVDLHIHVSLLGVVSAFNIFATAVSSIFWGYMADKGRRKLLIIIGTVVWSVSVFLTAQSQNYIQLIIFQLFTGIGLGCIGSIGFSVLTDYIPKRRRGMLMSLWGMSQGFGGIAGSVMASLVGTTVNWRKPFEITAFLGISFLFLYFFVREPKKGSSEPELKDLVKQGYEYNYSIKYNHIAQILTKRSNIWLFLQGFFMNITTGTLIWLPTLYISKITALGYSPQTAIMAAGFLFALLQIGGLSSMYLGHLGDIIQKKISHGRPLLAAAFNLIAMPLYILMFLVPMKHLAIPQSGNSVLLLLGLIKQIIFNPWMLLMFMLAIGATAAQSANTPNWLALLTDLNLPEHRATAFSISNLVNGMGRTLGNILIGLTIITVSVTVGEPNNYIITMTLFQFFFIPSIFCYLKITKSIGKDNRYIEAVLRKRARKQ